MTPREIKAAREKLGLTQQALAMALQVSSGRVIRGWESGEVSIPGPAIVALRFMLRDAANREGSAIPPDGQHQGRR